MAGASEDMPDLTTQLDDQKKKLREQKQKHKLDVEIKENQIRSLKQKLEQYEELITELKEDNDAIRQERMDVPLQAQHNLEKQHKKERLKWKKYEQIMRGALDALQSLGQLLSVQAEKKGLTAS